MQIRNITSFTTPTPRSELEMSFPLFPAGQQHSTNDTLSSKLLPHMEFQSQNVRQSRLWRKTSKHERPRRQPRMSAEQQGGRSWRSKDNRRRGRSLRKGKQSAKPGRMLSDNAKDQHHRMMWTKRLIGYGCIDKGAKLLLGGRGLAGDAWGLDLYDTIVSTCWKTSVQQNHKVSCIIGEYLLEN